MSQGRLAGACSYRRASGSLCSTRFARGRRASAALGDVAIAVALADLGYVLLALLSLAIAFQTVRGSSKVEMSHFSKVEMSH